MAGGQKQKLRSKVEQLNLRKKGEENKMVKELSCKKIKHFIKDEAKGEKAYKKVDEPKLANDEKGHREYWEDQFERRGCK